MIALDFLTPREGGRGALDAPVAALAGLSVAFVAFAMPGDLLAELVAATGLATILPAAEPPLGLKARVGLGAAGALATFALAFLLLRWLDRFGGRAAAAGRAEPEAEERPRLRRRDVHPDAPPRPPLLAGAELGEPGPAPEPDPYPEPEPEPEPEPYPEAQPEPEPEAGRAPPPPAEASLRELMARLERGLARRRSSAPPAPAAEPSTPPPPPPAADARLQSAIDSLQRLAARQS